MFFSSVMSINSKAVQHSLYDLLPALSPFMCTGSLKGLQSTQFHAVCKRPPEVLTQTEVSIKQKTTTNKTKQGSAVKIATASNSCMAQSGITVLHADNNKDLFLNKECIHFF